ncbi:MAG: SAM-dependent methyltransferase [Acidimicrobiia bacterium]|nr:SAM-dependent methyltransferase [Acidimicrobiia bacterium]
MMVAVTDPRLLPAVLSLFVGSGCAALLYEVVWFQLLELVIGSSAVSLGVLLGTFMGGMCLGSFLYARVTPCTWHPLRVYAILELLIGAAALALLFGVPAIGGLYAPWAGSGLVGIAVRALAAAICLLPPTLLMGATLPAVARWVEASPKGISWLGYFYGGNTAGAVLGSLLAGYYLLRVYDVAVTTSVGVAINAIVAVVAWTIARRSAFHDSNAGTHLRDVTPAADHRAVLVAIGLSGLTALACEVLWTRTLSLLFGATTYTFSLILAVFLGGLGAGSAAGSVLARESPHPRRALAWCQVGLAVAMAWTSYVLTESLPYWPVNPSLATGPWYQFQLDLARSLFAVFPGAVLWGASFPLALAALARSDDDVGRLVGRVYAANTLGAIVGSLGASLLLTVWVGTQRSQQLMMLLATLSAWSLVWRDSRGLRLLATPLLVAALLALTVQPVPGVLIAYGRYVPSYLGQSRVIYSGEGWNASVAVTERDNGVLNYHNAGKVQASSEPQDMRLQRMLGHLTTLVPARARNVLVIGCGAGVTAGAVSIDPVVEHETIAEIEPLVPEVVSAYFSAHNFSVVANPKVRVRIDDARHFLQATTETFDAITSDPLDPWVKGAAMLYTREFFELAKSRLNPDGVMTLFVQLYESNTDAVKSEIGTFFEAFPRAMIFANTYNGAGYDLVLLGQLQPAPIDVDAIQTRLLSEDYAPVLRSLGEIGMASASDLFATYAGNAKDYASWLKDAQINRDSNLRLQYLAGRGLNLYRADVIFAEMLQHAQSPPDGLFSGSPATLDELKQKILRFYGRLAE